jgi:hypothetical protein
MAKVKMWCRQVDTNQPLDILLARINPLLNQTELVELRS